MAWAFATAGQSNFLMFTVLASVAEEHLDKVKAQQFANLAWAFAKADGLDALLFAAFARMAEWHIQFKAQELARTA